MVEQKDTLHIAMIQNKAIWEDEKASLDDLELLIDKNHSGQDLIVLPEAFASGFSMNAEKVSQKMNGGIVKWMQRISNKYNTSLCGSVFIEENEMYFNRLIWVHPGHAIQFYDKRHLFSIGQEDQAYKAGHERLIIEFKGWKIFPQICYDLRFPVWSRNNLNYDLLLNVANWPAARSAVWKTLLKARAIENQAYVVGVNRVGVDGRSIAYQGNSMVVNYKGECIMQANADEGVIDIHISKQELDTFKSKFDTLRDADGFKLQ